MPEIIISLTEQEQSGLLSLIDNALRTNGRGALQAALHWEQKVAQAQQAAEAPTLVKVPDGQVPSA